MPGKNSVAQRALFSLLLALAGFQIAKASDSSGGVWQRIGGSVPPVSQPAARYNSATTAAVYASSINSMVFFGGYDLFTFWGDAWKLDLDSLRWSPLTSSTPPPPARLAHAAVYDAAHDRMVLYGGMNGGYLELQDLWAYEFASGQWMELPQNSSTPGGRFWASVVYNPKDTTMVLFGGQNSAGTFFNDVWILDLNQLTWRQVVPDSSWPDTRIAALVALDEKTNTLWTFGGFHRPGDFDFNEIWSLDLTTFQWTPHPMGSPAPPERDGAPAFFDPVSRSMVIFGGIDHKNTRVLNDMWAYSVDNGTWQEISTSGDIPSPRHNCLAAFVPAQNRFLLFGGMEFPILNLLGDAYSFNATDRIWQKISDPSPQPSARYNSATNSAVYAPSINNMVFFGGYNLFTFLDDAWKLDLGTLQWSPLPSSTPGPAGRVTHSAVYDAAHDRMVVYGGFAADYTEFQDLWAYEFQNERWVELPQGATKPGDRGWASALYNPRDTTMLLFGGQDLDGNFFNDVWILNLNSLEWQQVPPQAGWPDTRIAASVVLDEQTNTMWMFGGFHRPGDFDFNEIWSLDLATFQWTQHPMGSPAPAERDGAPAFFDPVSRSMVIFGGIDHKNTRDLNDLWAYSVDLNTWQPLSTSGEIPTPRHNCPGVFVPAQNRFLLFGGLEFPVLKALGDGYVLNLNPIPVCAARRGDLNADRNVSPSDVVLLLICVFKGTGSCDLCFADASCNGILNSVDIVVLLNAVFLEASMDCSPP